MPTYEYECLSCGHKFEVLQGIKEKPLSKCPKCSKKVRKLISSTGGFIFKGAGFYATDYKKPARQSAEAAASSCPKAKQGCTGCSGH
ncbi:MAG: zinc ribbon domain-containing protein [Candidatus Omnitrophica bacterium]|nr:zinc ribbon domain-containing protein [Candidatus Omnitrophota bacterium]MDD5771049.1 zinc ribbon domain-containing protein [Candidatus Omnitrophota bacterium]